MCSTTAALDCSVFNAAIASPYVRDIAREVVKLRFNEMYDDSIRDIC